MVRPPITYRYKQMSLKVKHKYQNYKTSRLFFMNLDYNIPNFINFLLLIKDRIKQTVTFYQQGTSLFKIIIETACPNDTQVRYNKTDQDSSCSNVRRSVLTQNSSSMWPIRPLRKDPTILTWLIRSFYKSNNQW